MQERRREEPGRQRAVTLQGASPTPNAKPWTSGGCAPTLRPR